MTIARDLSTPENRAFWGVPEPTPPKSQAVRQAIASCKRETAKRLDALIDGDTLHIEFRDMVKLIEKLRAEADALDRWRGR